MEPSTATTGSRGPGHGSLSEQEQFRRWQQHGDRQAREALVRRYLPLARKLARRYLGAREPLDDLEQVASLALVKAIDRYDASRGVKFQYFAVPTIVGDLKRYFRDCGWAVHMPRGIQELALQVSQAQRTLAARGGREPTLNQIAQYLEISLEDVLQAIEATAAHHAISLDTPHSDGDGELGTLADVLGAMDGRIAEVTITASIAPAAKQLTDRERRVLAMRFVEDRTQGEIAQEIGVSQMQVSRILKRALAQLSGALSEGSLTEGPRALELANSPGR